MFGGDLGTGMTPLADVEAALREVLAGLDPATVSGSDAQEALGRFGRIANMAAHGARLMGRRVDETKAWKNRGHRSAAESVAEALGCNTAEAARELGTARKVAELGATDAAARRGELSPAKAAHVASASAVDPSAEKDLLDLAANASAGEVREEARRRRHAAAGDDRQRHRRIRANRSLRQWFDDEGAARLSWCDVPEHGAEVGSILGPYIDQRFHQARRAGRREPRDRYAADALLDALRDAAAYHRGEALADTEPDPTGGPAARVPEAVTAPAAPDGRRRPSHPSAHRPAPPSSHASAPAAPEGAAHRAGQHHAGGHGQDPKGRAADGPPGRPDARCAGAPAPADADVTPPAPTGWRTPARRGADAKIIVRIDHQALLRGHTEAGEVCEIAGLGPVPVASVTALMDDAFLAAVITKGHDVVTVAHLGRAPTAHQRTAVQARPQRCTTLGCARTARLELDHATPYVDAGHTFVPDLDPSCEHCHGLKTYEGYRHTPGTGPRPLLAPAEQADWNRRYPDNAIAPIRPPGRRGPRPHSAGHPDQATGAATADPENRSSSAPEPSAGRPTAEPLTLDLDIGPPPTAA